MHVCMNEDGYVCNYACVHACMHACMYNYSYTGPYAGGGGFEEVRQNPPFCSLKLILSLNIKY